MGSVPALPVVTLAVYIVLIQPITYCAWKHGKYGLLGWLVFQVFCVVRIIGSILQIHDATSDSSNDTAALILANVGLSPLLLGSLGVLHEARTARNPNLNTKREWGMVLAYHSAVVGSMLLIILGVVHEIDTETTTPPVVVKIGVIGLLLCWSVFSLWTILSLQQARQDYLIVPAWGDATILLYGIHTALPFIGCRVVYSILSAFIQNPSFANNTAAKVILSTIPEMIVIALMSFQGIRTRKIAALRMIKGVDQSPSYNQLPGLEHENQAVNLLDGGGNFGQRRREA